MKNARKVKDNVEIQTGVQLHEITNLNLIRGAITTIKSEGPNCIFTYPYPLHPVAVFSLRLRCRPATTPLTAHQQQPPRRCRRSPRHRPFTVAGRTTYK